MTDTERDLYRLAFRVIADTLRNAPSLADIRTTQEVAEFMSTARFIDAEAVYNELVHQLKGVERV